MRVALALITQEQSTFNPVETELSLFEAGGIWRGQEILDNANGRGSVEGFLDAARARISSGDLTVVPIVSAGAQSAGRVSASAYQSLRDMLVDGLNSAGRVDIVTLFLHGACSATGEDDVDGALLAATREIVGPDVPIVLGLDHHANITATMVRNANAIVGFRTQPHDVYDTAVQVGELTLQVLDDAVHPVTDWRKLRLISHQEQYLTSGGPMKTWFDRARELEQNPAVLSISPFPMQPWLDVEEGGWAVTVVTDGDRELAAQLADEMADLAWSLRAEYQVATAVPIADAVAEAAKGGGLVILSDTGDSVWGGAAGDSTAILAELLRVGTVRALVPIADPVASAALRTAGVGAAVDLELGGSVTGLFAPVPIRGTVAHVDDDVVLHAPDHWTLDNDWGPVAVLEAGNLVITVSDRPGGLSGNHPAQYEHFGYEPADFDAVVVKTASNFQYWRPLARDVIRCNTPGPTQSDLHTLPWQRIPRPIYPLDETPTWRG